MGNLRKVFLMAAAVLLLSGCGGVEKKAYVPQGQLVGSTVGLIQVPEPALYVAHDYANPAMVFGAVGGAVAGAQMATESQRFDAAVRADGLVLSEDLNTAMKLTLEKAGFKVVPIVVEGKNAHKMFDEYAALKHEGVDAYLDIEMRTAGYATVNLFDREFRPYLYVSVQLISAKDQSVMFAETYAYGYHNPLLSGTEIDADKHYYYPDFSALMGNRAQAVSGLKDGVAKLSRVMQASLKP